MGYWVSPAEPIYPDPKIFVDDDFDPETKDWVIRYLQLSEPIQAYRGSSWCRFKCGESPPGYTDNTDGKFIFPSGFIHYVAKHNVRPPQAFIDEALENISLILRKEEERKATEESIVSRLLQEYKAPTWNIQEFQIDRAWWLEQASRRYVMRKA